ncbi:hypothetical protein QQX09_13730 [Demequina sp. SYSU T00192]|uniref:WD40-like Beta Propeller Repeat n=1 Tax=Demequina litoralis TaxID=3051660 RepID=A0ABT8GE16_9MICO|nr:hypothetical protein [Demequina sp. SYSU T00192]MDN4476914.1 hypothetical protein [Demequina sp. SYSU T00192]
MTDGAPGPAARRRRASRRLWIPAALGAIALAVALGVDVAQSKVEAADAVAAAQPDAGGHVAASSAPVETSAAPDVDDPALATSSILGSADAVAADACLPTEVPTTTVEAGRSVLPTDADATTEASDPSQTGLDVTYAGPQFSADGKRLFSLLRHDGSSTAELFSTPTVTSMVALGSDWVSAPVEWDPAGATAAVARRMNDGTLELVTVDGQSGAVSFLAKFPAAVAGGLSWSDDGACIALAVTDDLSAATDEPRYQDYEIAVVRVADGATTWIGTGAYPRFLPDGDVMYLGPRASGRLAYWRASSDGTERTLLTALSTDPGSTRLSSDREAVAYVVEGESLEVRVADTGARGSRLVARIDGASWGYVKWMADDSSLLVTGAQPSGRPRLWTIDIESGDVTRVKTPGLTRQERLSYAAPVPDGSGVVVMVNSTRGDAPVSRPVLLSGGDAVDLTRPVAGWASCAPTWAPDGDTLATCHARSTVDGETVPGSLVLTRR